MEDSKRKDKEPSDSEQHCIDELEAKKWQADLGNRLSTEREAKLDEMKRALASGELGDHDFDAEDATDPLSLALDEFEAAERNRMNAADSEVPRANAQFVESRERAKWALQDFFASRGDYLQPPQKLVVTVQDVRNFISKRNTRALENEPEISSGGIGSNLPSAVAALPRLVDGLGEAVAAPLSQTTGNNRQGDGLSVDGFDEAPIKKKALVERLKAEWPNIEARLREKSRNGLHAAAHAGKHGYWYLNKARAWALNEGDIHAKKVVSSSDFDWIKK